MEKTILIGFCLLALSGCGSDSEDCQADLEDCSAEQEQTIDNNWDEGNWNELEWK